MSPENQVQWSKWLEELPLLEQFKVEHCLVPANFGKLVKCELHQLCDASLSAYSCFLSLLSECRGKSSLHPVVGKVRVGPGR